MRRVRQMTAATSGRWLLMASAGQGADGQKHGPEETWTTAGNLANGSGSQCEGPWLQWGGLESVACVTGVHVRVGACVHVCVM